MNEGFATLYENFMLHLIYPNDRWMDLHQVNTFMTVMEPDASRNVRAMTYYVEAPGRIAELFNFIAYFKCEYLKID